MSPVEAVGLLALVGLACFLVGVPAGGWLERRRTMRDGSVCDGCRQCYEEGRTDGAAEMVESQARDTLRLRDAPQLRGSGVRGVQEGSQQVAESTVPASSRVGDSEDWEPQPTDRIARWAGRRDTAPPLDPDWYARQMRVLADDLAASNAWLHRWQEQAAADERAVDAQIERWCEAARESLVPSWTRAARMMEATG